MTKPGENAQLWTNEFARSIRSSSVLFFQAGIVPGRKQMRWVYDPIAHAFVESNKWS